MEEVGEEKSVEGGEEKMKSLGAKNLKLWAAEEGFRGQKLKRKIEKRALGRCRWKD